MKHRLTALAAAAAVAFGFSGDLLPAPGAADYTVFAAETDSRPIFEVGTVTATAGSIVEVPIYTKNMNDYKWNGICLYYDAALISTDKDISTAGYTRMRNPETHIIGYAYLDGSGDKEWHESFEIPADAVPGFYPIRLELDIMQDSNGKYITDPDAVKYINGGVKVSADTAPSGTCGENLTWTLDSEGTLTISGTGEMTDWVKDIDVPWYRNRSEIYRAVIEDGVTSIGEDAFYGCTGLTSVTIPDSVTSIEIYAFHGCTGLTSVTIPVSVTTIGMLGFDGCTGLTNITVDQNNKSYCDEDGVLFNKDKTALLRYPEGKQGTAYTIPDSVTDIGPYAFDDCTGLTSVTIPDSVTSIKDYAFYGCTGLTSVTIPDSVTSIYGDTFSGCTGLTSVTIPDSVTSIGRDAFRDCTGLTSVTIPDSVTTIEMFGFKGCTGLTAVTIPDSVKRIEWSAFLGCTALTEITILNPECELYDAEDTIYKETVIHGYAGSTAEAYATKYERTFEPIPETAETVASGTCGENLTWTLDDAGTLTISGTGEMTDWEEYTKVPWYESSHSIKKAVMKDGVTGIGKYAFSGFTALTEITIPDSVTRIGDNAFSGFTALTEITIPDSVTSIGEYAFFGCALSSVTIPESVTSIGKYAFAGCTGLTTATISDSVTSIENAVFFGCTSLADITIPDSVTSINCSAFFGCTSLTDITILNPECEIFDDSSTIPESAVIHGYSGSTAQAYAEKHKRTFVPLDVITTTTTTATTTTTTSTTTTTTTTPAPTTTTTTSTTTTSTTTTTTTTPAPTTTTTTSTTTTSTTTTTTTTTSTTTTTTTTTTSTTTTTTTTSTTTTTTTSPTTTTTTSTTTTTTSTTTTTTTTPAPTTTTTTATTTTTTTMTTTTTEAITTTTAVTTTEPAAPEVPFRYGNFNEWGFVNDRSLIGVKRDRAYMYYLDPADKDKLISMLTDTERVQIEERLANPVFGYCYGMSVTAVLGYYGAFSPSDLVENAEYLADIDRGNLNDRVRSAVNYYQLLQYTKAIAQTMRRTESLSDREKLQPLIDTLDAGKPAVLGYVYEGQTGNMVGHAVVAYAIEYQEGSIPFGSNEKPFRYNARIRIYDNQALNYGTSTAQDLFVNTSSWQWCIPMTADSSEYSKLAVMNLSAHHSGRISLVLTEPEIMNLCGLFGGSKPGSSLDDLAYERACVRYSPLNGIENYGAIERSPDGTLNAASGVGNIRFSADMAADYETDERLAYIDSDVGFYLAPEKAEAMSVSMEYEHYLLKAGADSAKRILFTPDGEIQCDGAAGGYEMSMVVDSEIRSTDWYKLTVSGKDGGNLKMQLEPDGSGLILSGGSLSNVSVHANSYTAEAERTFSTEYKAVRIYEIDENTIGIAADTDGNGTYETDLEPEEAPETLRGDADGDGEVTNKDAQMVLVAYTDSLGTGKVDLPDAAFKAADVDGDGKVGAGDAQYILVYYTENTIAGKPTKWEDLISG